MKIGNRKLLVATIVAFSLFVRLWRVSEIPPSLSWDEVSIGYNAYSILQTGRDEHGKFFPLASFAAYGDYKPPLAIYLTVPPVALFGLNEFSVRLPSVLAGALTVLLTYFVVKELMREAPHVTFSLAFLTAFLLAFSPWHIQLSRAGFEANIALFFVMAGVLVVLRARHRPKLLVYCWLPFVAAIYTFNSARYFVPLFSLVLLWYGRRQFAVHRRLLLSGCVVAVLALLPLMPHLLSKEARLRFTEVNIFTDSGIVENANARMMLDGNAWWTKIVHNRRLGYARSYLSHFFDHLQPWFLFIRGDGNPKFSLQDIGQLYPIELPFLVIGMLALFRSHTALAWLAFLWIVTAIIPAATARETPHALRIENSLPMWQFFIAYGLLFVWQRLGQRRKKMIFVASMAAVYLLSFSYVWHSYFQHYAKKYSGEWQYGYREAIQFVRTVKYQYERIVIDAIIGRPYMYTLFYDRFDPAKFQDNPDRSADAAGFFHVKGFDQYRFTDSRPAQFQKNTLYVLRPRMVPDHANVQETIRLLNGDPSLVIFDIVSDPNVPKPL